MGDIAVLYLGRRRHHDSSHARYDSGESTLAGQSQQETNKLREKIANAKGKKKRPEQRKDNGFVQLQVMLHRLHIAVRTLLLLLYDITIKIWP